MSFSRDQTMIIIRCLRETSLKVTAPEQVHTCHMRKICLSVSILILISVGEVEGEAFWALQRIFFASVQTMLKIITLAGKLCQWVSWTGALQLKSVTLYILTVLVPCTRTLYDGLEKWGEWRWDGCGNVASCSSLIGSERFEISCSIYDHDGFNDFVCLALTHRCQHWNFLTVLQVFTKYHIQLPGIRRIHGLLAPRKILRCWRWWQEGINP